VRRKNVYKGSVVRIKPVIGLAVMWWDAGRGLRGGCAPSPGKKIFL